MSKKIFSPVFVYCGEEPDSMRVYPLPLVWTAEEAIAAVKAKIVEKIAHEFNAPELTGIFGSKQQLFNAAETAEQLKDVLSKIGYDYTMWLTFELNEQALPTKRKLETACIDLTDDDEPEAKAAKSD